MNKTDWISERMVFGFMIVGGYLGCMIILTWVPVPKENSQLISQGVGALGTAVGVIVAAIWKTDKTERQAADTAAVIASKLPDNSGTVATLTVKDASNGTEPILPGSAKQDQTGGGSPSAGGAGRTSDTDNFR